MSACRPIATLRAVGLLLLLLGFGSAAVAYRAAVQANQAAAASATEYGSDGSLTLMDSKSSTHDIELYGGKLEVLMVQWLGWLQRPESLAIILAICSILIAVACFLVARHWSPGA